MEIECLALKDISSLGTFFSVAPEEDEGQSEQKENVCTEKRRLSPLKSAESTIPVLLMNRKASTPDLANITPIKHIAITEPWTPTSNLKVLISAASPDIRHREMKKVLFRPIENDKDKPAGLDLLVEDTEVEDSCQFDAVDDEEDAEKKPSRKQKSLGLLCQKFLALYPENPPTHTPIGISLDEVATSLGVERRRIYDIVNVLESLMIVGRIAKNSYTWYGRQRLKDTLEDLQRKGREQGYHLQMHLAIKSKRPGHGREDDGDAANAGSNRKDKSLRIMSQKFVMLFLVSKTQTVTLDAAAKILIEESQDSSSHSKYKTKVRRLYDIANVLTSLGLIKKVHVREERGRKPAFKWLGPVEFSNFGNTGNTLNVAAGFPSQPGNNLRKEKMARHASFNITPTSVAVQRQVSSAPSSPRCNTTGLLNLPVDYSTRTSSNGAVCFLQAEISVDSRPNTPLPPQTPQSLSYHPLSSTHPAMLPPQPHLEPLLISSPHCLAYLPNLSQPSVVMLYQAPDKPDPVAEAQHSLTLEHGAARIRMREESREDEAVVKKKKRNPGLEECDMKGEFHQPQREEEELQMGNVSCEEVFAESVGGHSSHELAQPLHYLYVPNNAGLNNLNFLIPAGQPPASVALPPNSVPAVALPYVLVPSAALPHYPLLAGSVQQASDNPTKLSFSLPAMMSPHFMVGATPYSRAAAPEISRSSATSEQSFLYVPGTGAPLSPSGSQPSVNVNTPEPLTPHTPKAVTASSSKAFFQTPGTLGSVVPTGRRRASAQRRLDIGHPAAI